MVMHVPAIELNPSSPEILNAILQSDVVKEVSGKCQDVALKYLHAMYTMKTRAAAYELTVDGKAFRVVVKFTDMKEDFAINKITRLAAALHGG